MNKQRLIIGTIILTSLTSTFAYAQENTSMAADTAIDAQTHPIQAKQPVPSTEPQTPPNTTKDTDKGLYAGIAYTNVMTDIKSAGDGSRKTINNSQATLKLGYNFNPTWALEGRVELGDSSKHLWEATVKSSSQYGLYGKASAHLTPKFSGYFGLGASGIKTSIKLDDGSVSGSDRGIIFSSLLGLQYKVSKTAAINLELINLGKGNILGASYDKMAVSMGMNYKF